MNEIKKLRSKAKLLGLDTDKLLDELAQAVVSRLPLQESPVVDIEQIVAKVEGRVGPKLEAILDALKTNEGTPLDPQQIITSVAALLQPEILKASEAVFARQKQALFDQMNSLFEAERKRQQPGADGAAEHGPDEVSQGGISVLAFFDHVLERSDKIAQLVDIFKGKKTSNELIAEQIGNVFRWHKLISGMERGQLNAEDLQKEINQLTPKTPK